MENKRKHLEFIQDVINRMARNSFLIKGWCITIVAALIALAAKENNTRFLIVTIIPIVMFWILDGYFLYQERLYRGLYDEVRGRKEEQIDYSMNTMEFAGNRNTWFHSIFSKTLNILYVSLILLVLLADYFIKYL